MPSLWRHMRHQNGANATHPLARLEHIPTTSLIKKSKSKREKYQNTSMTLLITQNTHVKVQKYPQIQR